MNLRFHASIRPAHATAFAVACGVLVGASIVKTTETNAAAPRPVGPLPFLPSIARVKLRVEKDSVVVTHAITLPKGDWKSGDLDLYVAHGAPGAPLALDARLHHVADGDLEPKESDAGEVLTYDRAPRCPENAHPLIGRPKMAGVILHAREAQFRTAAADGMAELRIRALYPLPVDDGTGAREVRVRLGTPGGTPLTLGRIQVVASDREQPVVRAEARLCGPDAETRALSLALTPKSLAPPAEPPVAPVLAVRHATDDLCVRLWGPSTTKSP
jgi:hypothetical protein